MREDSTGPLRGVVAVPQIELTVVRLKEMDAVRLRGTDTVILSRANRTNLKGASTVHVGNLISGVWRCEDEPYLGKTAQVLRE